MRRLTEEQALAHAAAIHRSYLQPGGIAAERSIVACSMQSQMRPPLLKARRSIDALHRETASLPGCDQAPRQAVDKYKAAHQAFHDDALGCVGF